jgi:hypothetical protein
MIEPPPLPIRSTSLPVGQLSSEEAEKKYNELYEKIKTKNLSKKENAAKREKILSEEAEDQKKILAEKFNQIRQKPREPSATENAKLSPERAEYWDNVFNRINTIESNVGEFKNDIQRKKESDLKLKNFRKLSPAEQDEYLIKLSKENSLKAEERKKSYQDIRKQIYSRSGGRKKKTRSKKHKKKSRASRKK